MSSAEGRLRLEYRLIVSRVAAWVIWLSAWLVLGRLGQTEAALTLGGLWPLAAWMLCMFGLLAQHRARRVSGLRLRLSLCLGLAAALIGQLLLGAKRHSLEGLSSDWIAIETIRDLLLILSRWVGLLPSCMPPTPSERFARCVQLPGQSSPPRRQ